MEYIKKEPTTKPTNIDDLLKQMLLENPELMKALQKEVPAVQSQPNKPREKKAPSSDYLLTVYCGCETCHAILPRTYNMKWDVIQGCFRPQPFCSVHGTENKELKVQTTTSRTCVACPTELGKLEHTDLVTLFMQMTDPENSIVRLGKLKTALRKITAA